MAKYKVFVRVSEIATTNYAYDVEADCPISAARIAQKQLAIEGPGFEPDERATDVDYTAVDLGGDGTAQEFSEADVMEEAEREEREAG